MRFAYKAKKGLNETVGGFIDADNPEAALNKLTAQGLFPISITEAAVPQKETAKSAMTRVRKSRRRITSRDILAFTQKLSTLLKAKVALLSSLNILYEQTENSRLQEIIQEVYNSTKEGKVFADSLACFPQVFSPLYVSIVNAGDASGRMDSALEQISEFLSLEENLKTKIRMALAYPSLLLVVGLSSIFILMNFVVPRLKPIFEGMGKQLPLITKVILKLSVVSNKSWWIIFGVGAATIYILYRQKGNVFFNRIARRLKMRLPVIKRLIKNQELAHFAQALSLLLRSGLPALKALEVATPSIEDAKLRAGLEEAYKNIAAGQGLSKSMENSTNLPNFFTKMVAVGEESGRLTEVLDEISASYGQQVEFDVMLITSLIEPIFILILGSILGVIVLSILLPTFQITQMVR